MNVKLLLKIKAHILAEPLRIYMDKWFCSRKAILDEGLLKPKCNTVACISGWAAELSGDKVHHAFRSDLLHLSVTLASRLFNAEKWPPEFQNRLSNAAPQSLEYAQVVADYIDYFIERYSEPSTVAS